MRNEAPTYIVPADPENASDADGTGPVRVLSAEARGYTLPYQETELNETITTDDRRKEIFAALVEAQDKGASVRTSRAMIARKFNVPEEEVTVIEREGLDQGWPPL